MPVSFPSTALRTDQRKVKQLAEADPLLIASDNNVNLVFCGAKRFQQVIDERRASARYERRVAHAIARGRKDIDAGRFIEGSPQEVIAQMDRLRHANA